MARDDKARDARIKARVKPFNASRLAQLIAERHNGNVSEAARFTTVKQPTLFNLLSGKYAPRSETLAKLTLAYGGSFDAMFGREARSDDDTYATGFHTAVRLMRRELSRIEESQDAGEIGPRAATLPGGAATVPASAFPPAVRDAALPAKKKESRGKPKKKQA